MIMMTTCKACNATSSGMISIFKHPNELDAMYTYVSGIQEVLQNDTLCIPCYDDLKIAYNFKKKCIQTNLVHQNQMNESAIKAHSTNVESSTLAAQAYKIEQEDHEQLDNHTNLTTLQNVISFTSNDTVIECDEVISEGINENEIYHLFNEHQEFIEAEKSKEDDGKTDTENDSASEKLVECETPSQSNVFACNDCGKHFSRSGNLKRHQRNIHFIVQASTKKGRNKFKRGPSPKVTDNDIFATLRETQCEFCFQEFSSVEERSTHETEHKSEEKPYKCFHEKCNSQFKERFNFRKHMETHSNEKKYKCRYCDQRFHQRGNAKSHERHHTGEKPYICDHCGKSFAESGNLKAHIRFHTGERPYPCPQCPKRFTTHYAHKIHIRSHTKERPYLCSDCGKRFTSSGKLLVHKRIHTGQRPYKCEICTAAFVDSSGLKRHSKTH